MKYRISQISEKILIEYMDTFIPSSYEYNMPKASDVINYKRLINYSVEDENFVSILINDFKALNNSRDIVDFDDLFLNKEILLIDQFMKFINIKIIELYYSSVEVQGILKKVTNKLAIIESSILNSDFSLTKQVIKNFKNTI